MKKFIIYMFILALISVFSISGEDMDKTNKKPKTVSKVDLKQYIGLWYEIAKIPNRFQKKCISNTTAEYRIRKDGRIDVINSCTNKKGKTIIAKGVAKVVDKKSNSKLKVSFVSLLGIRLFWGDYWIIGLDKYYQYAVIGDSKRKYGWVLAKTNKLTEKQWDEVSKILFDQGYDKDKFVRTDHSLR